MTEFKKLSTAEVEAFLAEQIKKAVGDFREHLGYPRDHLTAVEIENLKYCPTCFKPWDDEETAHATLGEKP